MIIAQNSVELNAGLGRGQPVLVSACWNHTEAAGPLIRNQRFWNVDEAWGHVRKIARSADTVSVRVDLDRANARD